MTTYGWTGKILRVDLTSARITETPTSDYVPQFVGGRGVAAMIYWELVPPECGAFDPENALIMMTGVANGTLSPSASRLAIAHKTPVPIKECYMWSAPGGHLSAELKFAGYDGVVVTGKSPRPVYLWICDGKAEIRSAERLWGMTLSHLVMEIQNVHGVQTRVAGIGPAGENLCRQAPIIIDREHATGITGAGAVMGSKNLKAIAVRGTGAVGVAKPKELIALWKYYFRLLNRKPGDEEYPAVNKSLSYYMYHSPHIPYCEGHPKRPEDPAIYFRNNGLDDPISLMREAVDAGTIKLKWGGCYACPVCCAVTYQSSDIDIPSGSGRCNDMESWPRHEWAGYRKVVGIPSIWFNRWCDDLGLSTTNTGGYHFFWIEELVKRGILTRDNTGLPVNEFWTLAFIRGILEKIAYRQGDLFDRIAEGEIRFLKAMSEEYPDLKQIYEQAIAPRSGKEAGYFLDKVAGQHDEYASTVRAIMMATGIRGELNKVSGGFAKSGVDKLAGLTKEQQREILKKGNVKYFGTEDATDIPGEPKTWRNKVSTAIMCQNLSVMMDCITYCGWANAQSFYSRYTPDYFGDPAIGAKVYSAVTGIEKTHEEMIEAMDAIVNIERCIHVREGRRRVHDSFNDTIFNLNGWKWTSKEEFHTILDEYYEMRGWDPTTGVPRRATLAQLGLEKIANELETKYGIPV
jgi:aldehyde:ferredoxin oxidoreductase